MSNASPSSPPKARWRPSKVQKASIVFFAIVALLLGAWWGWDWNARRLLQIQIDAAHARGEPILLEDFAPPSFSLSDADNAATYWRRAAAVATFTREEDEQLDGSFAQTLPFNEQEVQFVRQLVRSRQTALDDVARTRSLFCAEWNVRVTLDPQTRIPDLSQQRATANLLAHAARLAHHDGNDVEAIQRIRDLLRLGRHCEAIAPNMIAHLVSIGVRGAGVDAIEQIAPDLNIGSGPKSVDPATIRQLIDELIERTSASAGWKDACIGQRAGLLREELMFRSKPLFGTVQTIGIARQLKWHAQVAPAALEPNLPAAMALYGKFPAPPLSYAGFIPIVFAYFSNGIERLVEIEFCYTCDRRLAATALAISLYRSDHDGKYPSALNALVPDYLSTLLPDPLAADGRTFGYRPAATQPYIYSVGVDGVNDGGSIELTRKPRSDDDELPFERWHRKDAVFYLVRLPKPTTRPAE